MTAPVADACELAPIHLTGTIQPHGFVLATSDDARIQQVSANARAWLGAPPEALLGRPLLEALAHLRPCGLDQAIGQARAGEVGGAVLAPPAAASIVLSVHRQGEHLIFEAEVDDTSPARRLQIEQGAENIHAALLAATNAQRLLKILVRRLRRLSGFDRVMAYRFDPEANGQVVAESLAIGVSGYLGQHFPASDIPAPARALFLALPARAICDVAAPPVPMVAVAGAAPLDLTRSQLRAAAAVHIVYLRNMQVGASLTLSLRVRDRLWGLVACHHRGPRRLPAPLARAVMGLGRLASAALEARLCTEAARAAAVARGRARRLARASLRDPSPARALVRAFTGGGALFRRRRPMSAAIRLANRWHFTGRVPPLAALQALAAWLASQQGRQDVFATDRLPEIYPPAAAFANVASGLMAMVVPGEQPTLILWFFPERLQTISWAGRPDKEAGANAQLGPRRSFALFVEEVRHRAEPFEPSDLTAARYLCRDLLEASLERQVVAERMLCGEVQRQRARTALLGEATLAVGRGLDLADSCRALSQVIVESFCDWCVIYLSAPAGDGLSWRRQLVGHATVQGQAVAEELMDLPAIDMACLHAMIARRGEKGALHLPVVSAHDLAGLLPDRRHREFVVSRLGLHSLVVAPMIARGQLLGFVKMARSGHGRPFLAEDFLLGVELASHAAAAVDNASSFASAQRAIETRDKVMGVVSHDLRNPLNAISLTAERIGRRLARNDLPALARGLPASLDTIALACRRMDRLIQDILTLSKIDGGGLRIEAAAADPTEIARAAAGMSEPLAAQKGLRLRLVAAPPEARAGQVVCDRERILQALGNLLGNAIKFSPAGGEIVVRVARAAAGFVFSVEDQGPGIPAADRARIFERHWQADHGHAQGAGLGLSIVEAILRAHDSRCQVDSTLGVGTRFAFVLPAAGP